MRCALNGIDTYCCTNACIPTCGTNACWSCTAGINACCTFDIIGTSTITNRSEEHTSELQSLTNLVCRLLLEKKKINLRAWFTDLRQFVISNPRPSDLCMCDKVTTL